MLKKERINNRPGEGEDVALYHGIDFTITRIGDIRRERRNDLYVKLFFK